MAIILNDRDKALQAAPYRSKQAAVTISGTSSSFLESKNTETPLPATITLTATPAGSIYTSNALYTWSYALSSAPNTWYEVKKKTFLEDTTAKTLVLNNSDSWVKNAFVQYRCVVTEALLDTSYAFYTVTYTKEASDPVFINLSRTSALVTCDAAGIPLSYSDTDQKITVTRGTTSFSYITDTITPNTFSVSFTSANLTASAGTGSGTSWTQPGITGLDVDGATITYTIVVYDSIAVPTTYVKTVVYNKVSNGTIGAAGANYSINYDFAGTTLPTGVTYPGTITSSDGTTTTIQNTVTDQQIHLTNLNLIPANNYIISMRVKLISGTWEGVVFYANPAHVQVAEYYKAIPQPAVGVWTIINLDMRTLTVGGTEYLTGGNISDLRFDFINNTTAQVAIDYISIGKYGAAEATKSITLSMYQWAQSAPAYTGAFVYTWNAGVLADNIYGVGDGLPTGWTSAAGSAQNNGDVLYQRNITLTDVVSATKTSSDWALSSINTIGYRTDGTIGVQGDSYRIAYVVTKGVWTAPAAPTAGTGDIAPTSSVTVGGITTTWSKTATATLTDGQYMYQTDGIYNASTTNITWGTPYLSNLKVGSLQAISASLGTVQVASGGALWSGKSTFANATAAGFFLGNDSGSPKFRIGNADNTSGMSWDGSTLVANALTIKDTSGNVVISTNTVAADILNSSITTNRNLVRGLHKWTVGNNYMSPEQPVPADGRVLVMPAASYYQPSNSPTMTLVAGTYTLSFIAANGSGSTRILVADLFPDYYPQTEFTIPNSDWNLYKTTWTVTAAMVTASATSQLRFFASAVANGDLYIGNIKLEYGNYTPWCPNDLDSDNEVSLANAAAAQTAANTAAAAAATAQTAANTANTTLANIADDNVLTPNEKPTVTLDYNTIIAEQTGIDSQATTYGITTEKTTYDTAVTALTTYLDTLTSTVLWSNLTGNTTIVGTTFRTKFQDVYNSRQALLNKISVTAKAIADAAATTSTWSGVSGTGKPEDNATVGATAANLKVGTGNNLCVNSDFTSLANWSKGDVTVTTVVGLNLSTDWTLNKGTGEGTGTIYLHQASGTSTGYSELQSDPIVVVPGNTYFLSGYSGAHRCNVTLFIHYYNMAGDYIGNSNGTTNAAALGGQLLSGYYRHKEKIVPIANTAYIKVTLRKGATFAGQTDSYMFVTRVMFEETGAAATEPGNWCAPGVGKVVVTSIAAKLAKAGADILTGPISLNAANAIYVGTNTNGLYLGSSGIVGINNGTTKFSIDAVGNANFAGNLSGATGEFAGTLRAGVVDLSTFAGISYTYSTAGTYTLTVPTGKTSMRVTLVGAGGGGGAGNSRGSTWGSAGGGGGGLITQVFTGLVVGLGVSVVVGAGGIGPGAFDPGTGQQTGAAGTAGGNTAVWYYGTQIASANGGGGGQGSTQGYNQPQGGAAGGFGATAGQNGINTYVYNDSLGEGSYELVSGGYGGSSRYGSGGVGGGVNNGVAATVGGLGGGGGGGGMNYANNLASMTSANGGPGFAIIEFFDPNTVVLQSDFDVLKAALSRQGIAIT